MFNVAASLIEKSKYDEAEKALLATEQSCKESLEEDGFDEEEIKKELAPILTQLGFVQQRLGQNEAAMANYQAVLQDKPSDVQANLSLRSMFLLFELGLSLFCRAGCVLPRFFRTLSQHFTAALFHRCLSHRLRETIRWSRWR